MAAEKEETKNNKRRAEYLERELQQTKGQLENVVSAYDQETRKSNKHEVKLKHLSRPWFRCGQKYVDKSFLLF